MKKNLFKRCLFLLVLAILLMFVLSIIIKYDVEGEKKLPFSISKILLVSTVNGKTLDDPENIWNINVEQVNDVYIFINKTAENDETIKEIRVENFVVNKAPKKGELKLLRPTGELSNLYTHSEQNYLDSGISYLGGSIDDMKALEIANTGGIMGFRVALENLGNYISNDNEEINYDGRLLSNLELNIEEISFNISFDIIIKTSKNISFKGNLNIDMPVDNVMEGNDANKEITDFSEVVFKRVKY